MDLQTDRRVPSNALFDVKISFSTTAIYDYVLVFCMLYLVFGTGKKGQQIREGVKKTYI